MCPQVRCVVLVLDVLRLKRLEDRNAEVLNKLDVFTDTCFGDPSLLLLVIDVTSCGQSH